MGVVALGWQDVATISIVPVPHDRAFQSTKQRRKSGPRVFSGSYDEIGE